MPIGDLRAWVEVAMIAFVVVLAVGRLLQKQEGLAAISAEAIAKLTRQHDEIVMRMASKEGLASELKTMDGRFEQANKEMSRLASFVQGLDTRWRQEFVTRDVCDARMSSVRRELNGERPRERD